MRGFMIASLAALALAPQVTAQDRPRAAFRPTFNFDFRNTFVNGERVRFYGFRLGAQRGKDLITVGFYGLGDAYIQPAVDIPGVGIRELHTDFDYTALSYERLLVNNRQWQIGVPISIGLGNYRRSYRSDGPGLTPWTVNELVPLEASVHADHNIFRWLFVGAGVGYRHVLAADRAATVTLSDWTSYAKVGIRLGELLKGIFGKRRQHGQDGG
ncbi:MAG: hypothetical protein QY325_06805 [Flavobacteriales bacterium]|nr:MAG: hypothetical protein QY325_06805 [Flavobacteriales bacterium]